MNKRTENSRQRAEMAYHFDDQELFRVVCGISDQGLPHLEKLLGVELIPRGHTLVVRSETREGLDLALRFFREIEERYSGRERRLPDRFDLEYLFKQMQNGEEDSSEEEVAESSRITDQKEKILNTYRGVPLYPRTVTQMRYINSILENPVTFGLGPAGTGKTFLAIAAAVRLLLRREVERIIVTRPAVEAGESLGFLPGDMAQKVDPYLRPIYDALYECLGVEKVTDLITSGVIEIAPLAYMRGRTLNHAIVVLDEAQNCTLAQLKMFLTRLGKNSRMCIGGDVTQVDLSPGRSGLMKTVDILEGVEGISSIFFGREDIIRNPVVERIVNAFDRSGGEGGPNR